MAGPFGALAFWHWWILALLLAGLEILLPGTYLLWFGIAAGLTGLLLLLLPGLGWQVQLLLFAALALAVVVAWRAWQRRHPPLTEDATLNRRAQLYVGRVFALEEPIANGRGTVRVGDSLWRAEGPDLPAGARVRVTGANGTVLTVEPAEG